MTASTEQRARAMRLCMTRRRPSLRRWGLHAPIASTARCKPHCVDALHDPIPSVRGPLTVGEVDQQLEVAALVGRVLGAVDVRVPHRAAGESGASSEDGEGKRSKINESKILPESLIAEAHSRGLQRGYDDSISSSESLTCCQVVEPHQSWRPAPSADP